MAVEIALSNEMSRDMDPETAFLTSWLDKKILPKSSNWPHQSENTIPERKQFFFSFWSRITIAEQLFSRCIDLHGWIFHHKTSNVH